MNQYKPIKTLLKDFHSKPSKYWSSVQKKRSIQLFHSAYNNIPAYRTFMQEHNIKPREIVTWEDFLTLPTTSKATYLKLFPRHQLYDKTTKDEPTIFTSTSGTTGKPFYFLRNSTVDWRCSVFMEDFIRAGNTSMPKTLVVICFGMGVWIGGLITFKAFDIVSNRNNFPIAIITPGINKKEIFSILSELAPEYDQILFAGYPPFIKDIIDESEQMNLTYLKTKKIKIKFAAESISEGLRDYIAEKTNMNNIYIDTVNVYGSADIGAMAVENASSILVKRLILSSPKLAKEVFLKTNKIPTLAQFNPEFVSFESKDGAILLTSNNTLPLVRYEIGDKGGTYSFQEMQQKLNEYGIDIYTEAKKRGIEKYVSELPFVYVYERDDLSTTLYGLWIYPEWLRSAMYDRELQKQITGKFTMITKFDDEHNQYIELNIELKKHVVATPELQKSILKAVIAHLQKNSSEYKELLSHINHRAHPKIKLHAYEDPLHFKPGIKQKWVKKQ